MTDHFKQLQEIERQFVKRLKIGAIILIILFIAGIAWVVLNEKQQIICINTIFVYLC